MSSNEAAWRRTLDGLRADIETAEACAVSGDFLALGPFHPPRDLGPLPAAFADEVRELSARQSAVTTDLASRRRPPERRAPQSAAPRSMPRFEARA